MGKYKIYYDTGNDRRMYGLLDIDKNFNKYNIDKLKVKLINNFLDFTEKEYDQVRLQFIRDDKYGLTWKEGARTVGLTFIAVSDNYSYQSINPREKVHYKI